MNLGAFGKSKSPSIGAITDPFVDARVKSSTTWAKSQTRINPTLNIPTSQAPVGPAQILQGSSSSRYQPPVEEDFYYGADEVFTPETKSAISTPVLIVGSLALVGVLAYATGIVGKASR
jgi:hypothetical protein